MAQSAVGAIRAGCQMLSEGKAEIGKFKKQVEGGIADAKAIYAEVTGIWDGLKVYWERLLNIMETLVPSKKLPNPSNKPSKKKSQS